MTGGSAALAIGAATMCATVIIAAAGQTTLPPGDGQAVVQRMCGTACHAIAMVTNHRMSARRWAEVVDNMVVRGAVGTAAETEVVVRYLSQHFPGPDVAPPAPGPGAPPGTNASGSNAAVRPEGSGPGKAVAVAADRRSGADTGWPMYGHDAGGQRYSPLTQITPQNVASLRRVWTLTSEPPPAPITPQSRASSAGAAAANAVAGARRGRLNQVTPLVINDVMYLTTAANQALALEPETGRVIWAYDIEDMGVPALRGVAYWPGDGDAPPTIFFGTSGGFLVALNARTGKPVMSFAKDGVLSLRDGMVDAFPQGNYGLSSPPVVYKHLVITGSRVQEQPSLGPAGDVRAWDARTGKLAWRFHTIARPGEFGSDTWTGDNWKDRSGANVWGLMTVDLERGVVFLPLGSVTYDYYGGDRPGANLFGSTLVALDAATGTRAWHFQTTHHDIWDYDLESAPVLLDVMRNGQRVPAVAQMTKQGLLFILDRGTGTPIHGVEERKTLQDGFAPGEHPWPTQPFPIKPVPLARNSFNPSELANITPAHRQYLRGPAQEGWWPADRRTLPAVRAVAQPAVPRHARRRQLARHVVQPGARIPVREHSECGRGLSHRQHGGRPDGAALEILGRGKVLALPAAAMGRVERRQRAYRRDRVAGTARPLRGARETGDSRRRHAKYRRIDCHGRRAGVHRRHARQQVSRLRREDRTRALVDRRRRRSALGPDHVSGTGWAAGTWRSWSAGAGSWATRRSLRR